METEFFTDGKESIKNFEQLPDGSLLVWGRVARTGKMDYGSYSLTVPSETLFEEDSLNSLIGRAVTLEHPPSAIVSLADRQKYSVGTVLQQIVKEVNDSEPSYLTTAMLITDSTVVEMVKNGQIKELSPGYTAIKEDVDGSLIQKERRYNHVALTTAGRGGPEVKVLVDSKPDVAALVKLHTEHKDSLVKAGITPSYDWTTLELKQNIVTALTGKPASELTELQCDAVLTYGTVTKQAPTVPSVEIVDSDPLAAAQKRYIERISSNYKVKK